MMQNQTQIKQALDMIEKDSVKLTALLSCIPRGGTTSRKIRNSPKGESATSRLIRRKLNWLAAPPVEHGFPPFLAMVEITPEGSNGRPVKSYWLTEFGAAVLNILNSELSIKAPKIRDSWDQAHRYIIMETEELAKKEGLNIQVEYTLKNKVQEVRADLYLEINTVQIVLEVEQKLLRRNFNRAREKFIRWGNYIREENSGGNWRIYLVLNVRKRDLPTTIRYWQEALDEARKTFGELPYDIYCLTANELLVSPSFTEAIQSANLLDENEPEESELPVFLGEEWDADEGEQHQEHPDYVSADQYLAFKDALEGLIEAAPNKALLALSRLTSTIYLASYYPNSPTIKAAVFPGASIWLMRRYLEHPWMANIRVELAGALNRIHKRNPGMIMLRDIVTSLLWDVLLFHHGLGRGGVLHVIFQVPDFQDLSSDFRVEVRVSDTIHEIKIQEVKALSWFFTSIYIYRRHLGLVEGAKK
jgi:hypothetical protein